MSRTTTTTKRWTTSLSLLFTCIIALVMIMMSTTSFGPTASSSSSMVQCSQGATPTRHYPQMLDDGLGWAGYGIYIAIVLIIFAIFFFVIYNVAFYVWCCRCSCQVCGGSKPKLGGYSSNQIRLSILSNAGIFVVFSAMMILVMLFCILFTTTLRKVEKDTNGLADTFLDRIDNGIQSINNTDHIVDDVFGKLDTVVDSFSGLNSTIRTIDTSLGGAKQDVTDANSLLNHLQGDFTNMTVLITRIENGSGLAESPQSHDVPDLGGYTTELNNILTSLDSAQSNINSAYTTLNDLIGQVKTQVNDSRSTIQSSFSDVKSAVNEPLNQVTKYTDKGRDIMDQVFYYVNVVDNVRISLFITFLAVIFVIFAFGLVGVCCQWRWSPRLTACCSFFIPFLFIVIGLLHLILFIAFTDVCREVEPAVKRSQSLVDKYILDKSSSTNTASARRLMSTLDTSNMFQISEFNTDAIMGNISDIALDILYCSGNDSILDMIPGLETDFFNVTGLIDPVRKEINNTIQSFNASSLTSEASSFITDFYNKTNDLVTVSFQNATDYLLVIQSHVNEIYPQYDNYTRFGYDESIVEPKVDELNQESAKLGGQYWTLDNVTALDPASSPYVLNQTFFQDRRALLLDYKDARDEVISKTNSLKQDTLELNSTLNHCLAELNQLKSLIVNDQHIKAIQSAIDSVPSNVNDVVQSAMSVVDYAIDKVNDLIDNVTGIAHCNYIGNYYKSSKSNVCEQLGPFSGVITLSCWIISVLLLTWFVVLLPTTKRLGFPKDPEEEIEEMGHVEMDPMDHQMI